MNLAARMNLQRGIPENKNNEWTNYNIESPLDAYLVQRREAQFPEALEKHLNVVMEKKLCDYLEKAINDLLKSSK